MDRLTEHDLLALIEGNLSPDRVPVVEAALRADPALVERVSKMKDDRAALGALGATARAPAGLVDGAMARAGESQFVQVDTGGPVSARSLSRGTRARRVQMAVAASVGLALVGVWVALMLMVSSPSSIIPKDRPQISKVPNDGPSDEGMPADGVGPAAPVTLTSAPSVEEVVPQIAAESGSDSLLDEWMSNIAAAGESAPEPDAGMAFDEAARLALEGRLRITILGDGPAGHALASNGASTSLRPDPGASGADRWRAELRYRTDAASVDLALALERLVTELRARTGRAVRMEASDAQTTDPESRPAPLADASAILWWGAPDSNWSRRMVVRPVVSYTPDPE